VYHSQEGNARTFADGSVELTVTAGRYRVAGVEWRGHLKEIRLAKPALPLLLPRSACVSVGDYVVITPDRITVPCRNGDALLYPPYAARETVLVGNVSLDVLIKEITEEEEFSGYQALADLHYRGKALHGRTARLVARSFHPMYPSIIGYIELATPFYVNKPRSTVLNAPFHSNGIGWERWDMPTLRKYIHLLVRVARCVVYPEFRGIGLGQLLVKHAAYYAKDHWQVAGLKPYFLEISADMLKFVPFCASAGMSFIGTTEGNLDRVAKDVRYLLTNEERVRNRDVVREEACGIVDQQVSRMRRAAELLRTEKLTVRELTKRLENLAKKGSLKDFSLFNGIISLPKPTYLQGLTPEASDFLYRRVAQLGISNGHRRLELTVDPIQSPLTIKDLSISYQSRVRRTRKTHLVQQAFGISPDVISHEVIRNLSVQISAGQVVLITGPSGSGKTSILSALLRPDSTPGGHAICTPPNYRPGGLTLLRSQKPLVELLARSDVRSVLQLLGVVGLSDAFVYLQRFEELSNGQRYRASLAALIASGCNVWLADEFCSNLDVLTANVVASRVQRVARKLGAALIVASSQPQVFIASLEPDLVVQLSSSTEHLVVDGKLFVRRLRLAPEVWAVPRLVVSRCYLPALRSGAKRTTIRKGRFDIPRGPLILQSGREEMCVHVTHTRHCRFDELTHDDALGEGLADLDELRAALLLHYPDLKPRSLLTIIRFRPLCEPLSLWREREEEVVRGVGLATSRRNNSVD
jgi:ABC-type ATPase with predicted acetyltransferase domain